MMETIIKSPSSKKKSLDSPPSPVDISTPVKKKKKQKDKEIVLPSIDVQSSHKKKEKPKKNDDFSPLSDSDELKISHKKNKKKREINKEIVSLSSDVPSNHKKKRKKKREEEEEEENFKPLSDSDELIVSHKKKRKKEEEVSVFIPGDELMVKKKKKKNLINNPEKEGSVASETEEEKNRERLNKEEVVVATVSKHKDSSINIAAKNKKKKKKKDGSDVEGSSQEEETPKLKKKSKQASSATAAEHVNNEVDVTASLETSISSSTTKKDGIGGKSRKERDSAKQIKSRRSRTGNKSLSFMELDLDLVSQLEEFVPDVKNKSAPEIMKLLRYDLHRFKDFKQKGVPLRFGRFTVPENHQIEQNMADFLALTDMGSAEQVLFPQRFKEQAPKIRKMKILHCFFERIAEGIPRPCHQVYTRAKKIFDNRNHMGRFSEDELHSLQKLHQLHGNDWKAMSDKMDRSVYALQKRFVCLAPVHGPWGEDEESRLKQAVRDHLETVFQQSLSSGLSMDQLCSNLPWQRISQKVETRHWNQCRLKWFNLLKTMTKSGFNRGPQGYPAKILLINTLFSMSVDDLADIEWDEVAHAIGNVTPMCVQRMFHRLKVTKVPNWTRMSYGDIITFLQDHVVPALQKRLSSCSSIPESQEPQAEVKYQLSHIFSKDEDLEVDNT
ncbi:hypothetical protein OJAV_G00094290 [Oryzias javanicus]|uniref:Myb-like domain-containing protein n=1 Tax=Oryzias javanicus TaxID=123683 RepID=A0A3S2UDS0_ORYJA|nr:hypothetical protein OJAV_G00094290 [Oryzias javanicus]